MEKKISKKKKDSIKKYMYKICLKVKKKKNDSMEMEREWDWETKGDFVFCKVVETYA